MHRYQCVLTMLALYGGVVQSFSWDIVISRANRLEFYNEGTLTNSVSPTTNNINWITYDPFHDRVLFTETVSTPSKPVFSFNIATGKTETLINLKRFFWKLVYDPARELLFANIVDGKSKSIKSFLVKPGSDVEAKGNDVVDLKIWTNGIAADSCRGYIYWTTNSNCMIEKIQFNGTDREVIEDSCKGLIKTLLAIDPQTQKIYWAEHQNNITEFYSADLNGNNKILLYIEKMQVPNRISVSKDFIYWVDMANKPFYWRLPKNTSRDTVVKPTKFVLNSTTTDPHSPTPTTNAIAIASNYAIEEQTLGNPNCKALKSLLPNYSTIRDIPVCHNYCLQGNCSTSADGQPKCRCNAGYSGPRCEVDLCLGYCLNEGFCSINEKSQPVCRCSGSFEGDRCAASIFQTKFVHAVIDATTSMINDILTKEDGTSLIE